MLRSKSRHDCNDTVLQASPLISYQGETACSDWHVLVHEVRELYLNFYANHGCNMQVLPARIVPFAPVPVTMSSSLNMSSISRLIAIDSEFSLYFTSFQLSFCACLTSRFNTRPFLETLDHRHQQMPQCPVLISTILRTRGRWGDH